MIRSWSEMNDLGPAGCPTSHGGSVTAGTSRSNRASVEQVRSSLSIHVGKGLSWQAAGFLLINAALGAGVLHFPYAYFFAGGIISATVMQIILLVLLGSTMIVLASAADLCGDNAYHDVMRSTCGPISQRLAAISVVLACYGVSLSFLVIIGDQYDRIFLSLYGITFCQVFYLRREFTIIATATVFILPFCFYRKLDFLKYVSAIGVVVMLYPVVLIVLIYSGVGKTWAAGDVGTQNLVPPQGVFHHIIAAARVVPTVCFAYQTHEVVVPIYANMRQRNLTNMTWATCMCMAVLFFIYSVTGIFGYLTFGAAVRPDIMQNFEAKSPYVIVGIGALIIKMASAYPLLLVCGRNILESMIPLPSCASGTPPENSSMSAYANRWASWVYSLVTLLWLGSSLLLATIVSNLAVVIQSIGALACANVFIFPGMCLIGISTKNKRFRLRRPVLLYLVMGFLLIAIGSALATVVVLQMLFDESSSSESLLCKPEV